MAYSEDPTNKETAMYEFTESQMVSCAATNVTILEKMQAQFAYDIYALDPEYNQLMGEVVIMLEKLTTSSLRHKYDAEIKNLEDLRSKL